MKENKIQIGIIGAGSIGSLFGGYLANIESDRYKTEVIFFGREKHIKQINSEGLHIVKEGKEIIIQGIKGFLSQEEYLQWKGDHFFHFLFLSTKTYDIEKALNQYKNLLKVTRWLVVLQNGVGNEEIISNFIDDSRLIRIVTSNGALLEKPGKVKHTGKGYTKIGFPYIEETLSANREQAIKDLTVLKNILNLGDIHTEIVGDIQQHCWDKVFVNIGINAIGTLTRLRNGELLKHQGLKDLMKDTIKEAIVVAKLKDIKLSEINYIQLCFDVAQKTQNNRNSMFQDILKGKPTEIDYINGKIVKYAQELGIDVPINTILTYLIKGLEKSSI